MGALATSVINSLSTQRLSDLTNLDRKVNPPVVNTARLAQAETNAINEFTLTTGTPFDPTNSVHVTAGYWGVISWLFNFRGVAAEDPNDAFAIAQWKSFLERAKRNGGTMDWVPPSTTSGLTITPEGAGAMPWSDPGLRADCLPGQPASGNGFTPPTYRP